ncbi:hypothetical protein LP105_05300 [Moraxella bovis]|nr:hypothetical protein [Moraxella bovis]UYZ74115.1 hypothetical protein LP105_05300 [Moraxella bovis]
MASETAVNVELKHGTPFVKAFNNLDLDALRVRLKWGALRQQNRENGDVSGVKIDYAIDIKTDNGGWVEALNTSILLIYKICLFHSQGDHHDTTPLP